MQHLHAARASLGKSMLVGSSRYAALAHELRFRLCITGEDPENKPFVRDYRFVAGYYDVQLNSKGWALFKIAEDKKSIDVSVYEVLEGNSVVQCKRLRADPPSSDGGS